MSYNLDWKTLLDPGGVLHEGGFFGWDLANLDHTSEDLEEAKLKELSRSEREKNEQLDDTIENISKTLTIIFFISIVVLIIWWSYKHGYLNYKSGNVTFGKS